MTQREPSAEGVTTPLRSLHLEVRFQAFLCLGPRDGRFRVTTGLWGPRCKYWDEQNGTRRARLSGAELTRIVTALAGPAPPPSPRDEGPLTGAPHYGYAVVAATARVEWADGRTLVVAQASDVGDLGGVIEVVEGIALRR